MKLETTPAKKTLLLNILDILKRYTDADHRLSQKQIEVILQKDYNMTVERKAVKRNLMNLIDLGYEIEYNETIRMAWETDSDTGEKRQVERAVQTDFYLMREFTDSELRLLIDSLLFSRHIPYHQCRQLVQKLEGLSNQYFNAKVRHIATAPQRKNDNKQLFYTIDILDEAISKNRQVSFAYYEYGTDKQLHKRCRPDGSVREYIVNPYQMAAKEGKYYLICNYDKYNDISNYRLDRITDIKILETRAKPFSELDGAQGKGLDLEKYMAEHIYMFSSENSRVNFRIVRPLISDVIDLFGDDVRFSEETDTHVTVSAYVNEKAMVQFAKSFAPDVVILSPSHLTQQVKADLEKAVGMYGGLENEDGRKRDE